MESSQPDIANRSSTRALLRSSIPAAFLIVLAGLAVYLNSLDGPFIFDDEYSVQTNPSIRSLWPLGPVLHPPRLGRTVEGRPVLNLSFAINYALCGLDVRGYHALNLAIHLSAALLLFALVRRAMRAGRPDNAAPSAGEGPSPADTGLALAVALLWVVHPLLTSAVTYINQRAESLAALFYLLVAYGVVRGADAATARGPGGSRPVARRGRDRGGITGRKLGWYALAVAACALGMATKEIMVTAPLAILLYDRTFLTGAWQETWRRRWPLYLCLSATWGLLAVLVASTGGRSGSAGFGREIDPFLYALTQAGAITRYVALSFWPDKLILDYGVETARTAGEIVGPALLLLALLSLAALAWFRSPRAGFPGVAFFLLLAPSSSVVPIITQTVAEHRMYLPLAAVLGAVVAAVWALLDRLPGGARRLRPALMVLLVAGAVVALGWRTVQRNRDYRSVRSIWQDTADKRPGNARAFSYLGIDYLQAGDLTNALRSLDRALEVDPTFCLAYNNRSTIFTRLGQPERAIADLTRAIESGCAVAEVFNNRGGQYSNLGRYTEAIADFNRALASMAIGGRSTRLSIHVNRSWACAQLALAAAESGNSANAGRFAVEAIKDCNAILAVDTQRGDVWCRRGDMLRILGRYDEAAGDDRHCPSRRP